MSRFFVGQRVRLVVTYNYHDQRGREFTIVSNKNLREAPARSFLERQGREIGFVLNDGGWVWAHQIEPATDANTVISFDACIWKPDHLRSRVEVGP